MKEAQAPSKGLGEPMIAGWSKKPYLLLEGQDLDEATQLEREAYFSSKKGGPPPIGDSRYSYYLMSYFKMSNNLIKKINVMVPKFWWRSLNGEKKMHLKRWTFFVNQNV